MSTTILRPVGAWLGESFGRLGRRWVTFTALFAFGAATILASVVCVYGLGLVFAGFLTGWDRLGRIFADPTRLGYALDGIGGMLALLNLVAGFVALRLYCVVLLALVHASADDALGFRDALRRGKGRGYAFLVLFLVQQLMLQAGFVLLIVPGLVLATWFSFALWAFARDASGILESLGQSARAVRGRFFGVLGRLLLVGLIGALMMIVPIVGWVAGAAWTLLAWAGLYDQLQPRRASVTPAVRPALAHPARPRAAAPLKARG